MHGTVEASKLRKGESAYNPWTHISHKELIYLLQKSSQPSKQSTTTHAPRGIDWQENTIARPRQPLRRKTIKRATHATNLSHNFYHTCMLQDLPTSTKVFLNFIIITSMTLTLLPLYLKTIIKHQVDHSIQFFFCDSFYYTQLGCSSFQDQFINIANTMLF